MKFCEKFRISTKVLIYELHTQKPRNYMQNRVSEQCKNTCFDAMLEKQQSDVVKTDRKRIVPRLSKYENVGIVNEARTSKND